jgi:hypothetical protein
VTFADPRELRKREIAAVEDALARARSDEERAPLEARLRELKKFRLRRLLWPGGPHGQS